MNSTKKNFILSVYMLILGVALLLIANSQIIPKTDLGRFVFYIGCGFIGSGLVNSILNYKILNNPYKLEEVEINESDERNILIKEKTNSNIYSIFIYIECAMIFIFAILGYESIVYVLSFLVALKILTWSIVNFTLFKKY